MWHMLRRGLCLGLVFLGGCYSYRVASPDTIAPGTDVRIRISAAEASRLADALGREDRVLVGELVGAESGTLLLQVRSAGSSAAIPLYQRVTLEPASILELEVRRLDRVRTLGIVGVITAGAVATLLQLTGESEPSGGEGPGTDAIRIPFWTSR